MPALELVGKGLKKAQFAVRAAGQLFSAAPSAEDLRIRAVLDWVMFRRRGVQQGPAAATTHLKAVTEGLRAGTPIPRSSRPRRSCCSPPNRN